MSLTSETADRDKENIFSLIDFVVTHRIDGQSVLVEYSSVLYVLIHQMGRTCRHGKETSFVSLFDKKARRSEFTNAKRAVKSVLKFIFNELKYYSNMWSKFFDPTSMNIYFVISHLYPILFEMLKVTDI